MERNLFFFLLVAAFAFHFLDCVFLEVFHVGFEFVKGIKVQHVVLGDPLHVLVELTSFFHVFQVPGGDFQVELVGFFCGFAFSVHKLNELYFGFGSEPEILRDQVERIKRRLFEVRRVAVLADGLGVDLHVVQSLEGVGQAKVIQLVVVVFYTRLVDFLQRLVRVVILADVVIDVIAFDFLNLLETIGE